MSPDAVRGWPVSTSCALPHTPPLDGVEKSVALTAGGVRKESAREEQRARGCPDEPHGIVHAGGDDRLERSALRPAAKDVGGAGLKITPVRQRVPLLGEGAFAPVDPAIRAEVRAVKIIRAAGQRHAIDQTSRPSATPSSSVSVSFQICGAADT